MIRRLVALWAISAIVACATASQRPAAPAATAAHEQPPMMAGDPHAQIEQLSANIEQQRQQMGLPAHATTAAAAAVPMAATPLPPPAAQDKTCHPAPSETCSDSCKLSDSICDSAGKICKLAEDLAGDTWAADKCTTARDTCDAAHHKCCGCM